MVLCMASAQFFQFCLERVNFGNQLCLTQLPRLQRTRGRWHSAVTSSGN
jgi:hypothetical protein